MYYLVSRYAAAPNNCNALKHARTSAPLAAHEIAELEVLRLGASSVSLVPDFVVPSAADSVTKYDMCLHYNVVYQSVEGRSSTRNSLVACDLYFCKRRSTEATRCYGKIRYFLGLRLAADPQRQFCIAYVDWYQQTEGDSLHVFLTHPQETKVSLRAVPISAIV